MTHRNAHGVPTRWRQPLHVQRVWCSVIRHRDIVSWCNPPWKIAKAGYTLLYHTQQSKATCHLQKYTATRQRLTGDACVVPTARSAQRHGGGGLRFGLGGGGGLWLGHGDGSWLLLGDGRRWRLRPVCAMYTSPSWMTRCMLTTTVMESEAALKCYSHVGKESVPHTRWRQHKRRDGHNVAL